MLSLCPGQNKILSRFPFVLGQTPLSRDVLGQNELKNFKRRTRFPVIEHPSALSQFVPCPVPDFGCPRPWQDF